MSAVAVLEYVISLAAEQILQYIKDGIAGPPADRISEVIKNQEAILKELQNFEFKVEALDAIQSMKHWTKRTNEIIGYMKAKSGKIDINDEGYQLLLDALKNGYYGVRRQTLSLYDAVMGSLSDTAGGNALKVWHDQCYVKVSERTDFKYFLSDYVADMDKRIGAVALVLRQGLVLSLFTARDNDDAKALRDECEDRIRAILRTLYETYYPPALRFFKKSYDELGDIYQPTLPWFWLRKKGTDSTYLCMKGLGHSNSGRMLAVDTMPVLMQEPTAPAWKFSLHRHAQDLGSLQLLCNWADDGKQVINLRTEQTVSQWGAATDVTFTTNTGSGGVWGTRFSTQPILFKLIPLPGTTEPAVHLVPFSPGSKSEFEDTYKIFRSTFILATEPVASGGVFLPAPVEWGST